MEGWIKVYRAILDKPIWFQSSPEHKTILITLLLMANHEEREWEWQGQKFKVYPGQFITSLDSIVKKCGKGISIQNVRSALSRFQNLNFLTNKSTKSGRLITIVNWGIYQEEVMKGNKGTNKEVTKNQQRGNKKVTPNKNDKNVRMKEDINNKQQGYDEIINLYTNNHELKDAIFDFIKMRKTIKKPLTDRALQLTLNRLDILTNKDIDKVEILNQSIANCWQGVFELREKQPGAKEIKNETEDNGWSNYKKFD